MSQCRIHLKKLVCQAANQGLCFFERHLRSFGQWSGVAVPQPWLPVACVKSGALLTGIRLHCTAAEEPSGQPIGKKKEKSNAKMVIGNVGRLIPYNLIQVISENGEDLGEMNRSKAIQIMKERDLKLVALRENANPPLYKLMTGKQLFEKQSQLREKQKLSSGPSVIQIKEMSFLTRIDKHDLEIKKKQLSQWIEKKHHVRITIIESHSKAGLGKEAILQEILKSLENRATCTSDPKEGREGRAVICVLRPLSEKELQKQKKDLEQKEPITTQEAKLNQSPSTELPDT